MKPRMIPAILLFLLLLAPDAYSMSSTGYRLDWFAPLTTGGGGASGSPSYAVNVTVGQSVIGATSSTGYKISLGYWVQQLGSLAVTISPAAAVTAGAQWKRVGTATWLNSGSTETGIPEGSYTVEFNSVAGWTTPASVSVTISTDVTTAKSATYIQLVGTIVVNPDPNSINAPWTLTGPYSYSRSGTGDATIINLPIGEYTLTWGNVTGWTKPSSPSVTQTVTTSGTITFSGTYIQGGMFYVIPNKKGGAAIIYLE
jgi:hypothetical protein